MIESYRIGIDLALHSNAASALPGITRQFEMLDKVIRSTQSEVNALTTSMRGLSRLSSSTARSWQDAAAAMTRAANAANRAGGAMRGAGAASYSPYGPGAPATTPPNGRSLLPAYAMPPGGAGGGAGAAGETRITPAHRRALAPLPLPAAGGGGGGGEPPAGGADVPFAEPEGMPEINPKRRRARRGHTGLGGVMETGFVGYLGADVLAKVFGPTFAKHAVEAGLMTQGLSKQQVAIADKQAVKLQHENVGISQIGALSLTAKLMAVMQNPKEAIKMTPAFARLGVVLDAYGKGDEGAELFAAIRAGDFRGSITHLDKNGKQVIDPKALVKFVHELVAETVASHGHVGPNEILNMIRAGGITGVTMSSKELFGEMMSLNLALGSSRAGTGLQAFGQQFGGGKINQAAYNMLQQMGIVRPGKAEKPGQHLANANAIRAGLGQYILLPGAINPQIRKEAYENPLKFLYGYLMPKVKAWNAKNYGKSYTSGSADDRMIDDISTLQAISSRIPGANFAVLAVKQRALVERDLKAYHAALGRNAFKIETKNNPLVKTRAFTAALQGFEIALGDAALPTAIKVLDDMTDALNHLSSWATKHPDGAKHALEGLAGGILLLGGAATAALMVGIARNLKGVAVGMSELEGPVGVLTRTGGIFTLALALSELAKTTTKFPHWLLNMATGAAVGAELGGPEGALAGAAAGAMLSDSGHHKNITVLGPMSNLNPWMHPEAGLPSIPMPPPPAPHAPMPVTVHGGHVALSNPGDLKDGIVSGIAHDGNHPQPGPSGGNPARDPWGASFQPGGSP